MVSFDDISIAFQSKTPGQLRKTYFLFWLMNKNSLVKMGTSMISSALSWKMPVKGLIKKTLFSQFCGGETIEESEKAIQQLKKFSIGTILDYSVEGEDSEKDFESTKEEILRTIVRAAGEKHLPYCVFKITGVGSSEILAKVQRGEKLTPQERASFERLKERVELLCKTAFEKDVRLLVDAEESWIQDTIDSISYQMMEKYNKKKAIVFNTFQMYRKDMLNNLKTAYFTAHEKEYFLGVKIVRGAYMEKEREVAKANGYDSPIQNTKLDCDRDFNEGLRFCVEHIDKIELCCGTHNEQSNYLLVDLMAKQKLRKDDPRIYFVQLYGMSDHISYNLSHAGYNVAKYVPYGPVESVIPYLIRRANENTAIAGQSSREFTMISKEVRRRTKA
jgi:proline dehydrogenase